MTRGGYTMATKQITTWAEFKTALTETITENTTYEIMNDIDVSDEILSSTITLSSQNYRKTFQPPADKENVTINGITAYSNISIFNFRYNATNPYTFNNLHFANFMIPTGNLFNIHTDSDTNRVNFNDCLFNGLSNYIFANNGSRNYATHAFLTRCSINVKCRRLFGSRFTVTNSYIRLEPFSADSECSLGNMSDNYQNGSFYNCYFCGIVRYNFSSSTYMLTYAPEVSSNVYNIDTYILNYNPSTTYSIVDRNFDPRAEGILYNIDKFYNAAGENVKPKFTSYESVYGLTDSQMKSKAAINQYAPHFPLWG